MNRRDFLKLGGVALSTTALSGTAWTSEGDISSAGRPNILWISTEDISPDLGCYGDDYAVTPNIDAFAAQGTRFEKAFSHMGVCAPARSGIITGCYPTSIGTNHMRCKGVPPPEVRCFTEYLRAAGYYCTNRSKTDYQFDSPDTAWDICGKGDDWNGRAPGQPFFSVINYTGTHESKARSKEGTVLQHDPAKAMLPPYYPDTPTVRRDWAQYYDNITELDKDMAAVLKRLEDDGLAEDTIVWFWGDHGRGLPRAKRWIYDSGLHVPLIIRVPEKWRPHVSPGHPAAFAEGTVNTDLVAFVDFAPTMLSLCTVPIPSHMEGRAFLGPQRAQPRETIFGARDRVDEAYDLIRCVRDKRYKYVRNFMRHLPRSLDIDYMNQMPTMQEMRRLYGQGKLTGPQLQYFESPKPLEELYDTLRDPHEVNNLAGQPEHQETLNRLRMALFAWMSDIGDFGLLPECEFDALKRPDDVYETASAPGIMVDAREDKGMVRLSCNTPGASMVYRVTQPKTQAPRGEGAAFLAQDAHFNGKKPWPKKSGDHLSQWRNSRAFLQWEGQLETTGTLSVHVTWSCGGKANSEYILQIADQRLKGRASHTGGWDHFETVKLGEVEIKKPGPVTVLLKPVEKSGVFQMDLQSVVLGDLGFLPSPKENRSRWLLYHGPFPLSRGQSVEVKSCRLGFRDSPSVRAQLGDEEIPPEEASVRPHWREIVTQSRMIDRILNLKRLEGGEPEVFLSGCKDALKDPEGSVRYWGVIGLHQNSPKEERKGTKRLLRSHLKDPSHAVRMAAAEALWEWGDEKEAMPIVLEGLQHPMASARTLAATVLYRLGSKARSALTAMREVKDGYAGRLCKDILKKLEQGSPSVNE